MVLKKPSEYFKKDIPSVDNSVQELVKAPEMNTFSDAFDAFKNNLSKIEVLSNFSETLDNYRVNIERVNHLSSSIEDIKTEVQTLLKKEDLDRAMMSQLLVVEQSIRDVQNKVKGINEKNLTEIRLDVSGLINSVNEFLENDVPKYKKLVVDSELRTSARYEELEDNVNQTLEGIGEFVENKYQQLTETLEGINEKSLTGILEDFKVLENNLQKIQEEDIPKYKGFIVETERKTETKLNEIDEKILNSLTSFEDKIVEDVEQKYSYALNEYKNLENIVIDIKDNDIPKYKGFIVESGIKVDSRIKEFNDNLNEITQRVLEKINEVESISTDNSDLVTQVTQKIEDVKNLSKRVFEDLRNNENYKTSLNEKLSDLQVEIVRNESHIKSQTKNFQELQEEVREHLSKINLEVIEEKSEKLGKKIKYLEEVFEKFNEKEIFAENFLAEPPSIDNKDPLTPLDQKFVTLDQLQEHYRLFLNRIQQQLLTFGGGGETQLKYLDDVVGIATNAAEYDNKFLKYNHSIQKFELVVVDAASTDVYWVKTDVGIHTLAKVGIGTTNSISQISVGTVYGLDTNVIGVTTTDPYTISSFPANTFRSARFQVQITQGTDYQTTDLLTIHNGTTVNLVEYGSIATNDYLGSFSGIILGGDALLQVTMVSQNYAEVKIVSQKITI